MIYTLTFNPSLDYVAYADDLEEGKIHKISDYDLFPGGKGINVSQVLKQLGVESVAWGYVAGVTGESLKKLLDEVGIVYDFIELKDGLTRINVKLRHIMNSTDSISETDFNGAGLKINKEALEELKNRIRKMSEADTLVISGSIPTSVSLQDFDEILDELDKKGSRFIADVTGKYLEVALEHKPYLVKPNEEELKDFYNNVHRILTKEVDNKYVEVCKKDETVSNISNIEDMAGCLIGMGAVNVLVSLGDKGAFLLTKEGDSYRIKPPHGDVVNTVGAGDSMVAGFIAGLIREDEKNDICQALKLAVCAGSASAFSKGLATKETIERLMNEF